MSTSSKFHDDFYAPNYDEGEVFDKKTTKELDDLKKEDKHFYSIPHATNVWFDEKFYKQLTIECYSSGGQGTRIRDAVTGEYTRYLVGSANEDLFYTMRDATGRMTLRDDAGSFFYSSPEQYERNRFTTVSPAEKDAWNRKYIMAIKRLQDASEKSNPRRSVGVVIR